MPGQYAPQEGLTPTMAPNEVAPLPISGEYSPQAQTPAPIEGQAQGIINQQAIPQMPNLNALELNFHGATTPDQKQQTISMAEAGALGQPQISSKLPPLIQPDLSGLPTDPTAQIPTGNASEGYANVDIASLPAQQPTMETPAAQIPTGNASEGYANVDIASLPAQQPTQPETPAYFTGSPTPGTFPTAEVPSYVAAPPAPATQPDSFAAMAEPVRPKLSALPTTPPVTGAAEAMAGSIEGSGNVGTGETQPSPVAAAPEDTTFKPTQEIAPSAPAQITAQAPENPNIDDLLKKRSPDDDTRIMKYIADAQSDMALVGDNEKLQNAVANVFQERLAKEYGLRSDPSQDKPIIG